MNTITDKLAEALRNVMRFWAESQPPNGGDDEMPAAVYDAACAALAEYDAQQGASSPANLAQPVDVLAEVGRLGMDYIAARRARMAARRARSNAAVAFYDEHGSDAAYSDESAHPRGFAPAFLAATAVQQAAYEAALRVEKSCRQKFYRAAARIGGAK